MNYTLIGGLGFSNSRLALLSWPITNLFKESIFQHVQFCRPMFFVFLPFLFTRTDRLYLSGGDSRTGGLCLLNVGGGDSGKGGPCLLNVGGGDSGMGGPCLLNVGGGDSGMGGPCLLNVGGGDSGMGGLCLLNIGGVYSSWFVDTN